MTTYTIFTSSTPLWCLRCETELPTGSDIIITEHDDGAYCVACGKGAVKRERKQEERAQQREVKKRQAEAGRPLIRVKAKRLGAQAQEATRVAGWAALLGVNQRMEIDQYADQRAIIEAVEFTLKRYFDILRRYNRPPDSRKNVPHLNGACRHLRDEFNRALLDQIPSTQAFVHANAPNNTFCLTCVRVVRSIDRRSCAMCPNPTKQAVYVLEFHNPRISQLTFLTPICRDCRHLVRAQRRQSMTPVTEEQPQ